MKSAQRNHIKKQIEEIKLQNTSLKAGQVGWIILGLVTLITIIGPYLCYGYVMKYSQKRIENMQKIIYLQKKLLGKTQ